MDSLKETGDTAANDNILGVMVAKMPTPQKAHENAKAMKNCPRLLASGTNSNVFIGVFILPHDMEWWLKIPEEKPDLLGAETVRISIAEHVVYGGGFQLRSPDETAEVSPCGSNCANCPQMEEVGCKGCPATTYYQQ